MSSRLADEIKQSRPFASPAQEMYFNLIRTADVLSRSVDGLLKAHDLSQVQYNVLRILRGAGEAGLPCHDIGQRLITRDPDVTRLIDRLERRGLVTRARDQQDRRVVTVRISPSGIALVGDLDMDRRVEQVLAPHAGRLSPAELASLSTLLEHLREQPQGT